MTWSTTYSHALLYGLAAEGVCGFDSSRPAIDRAFDRVSEGLLALGFIPRTLRCDPIFGTYSEVDEILIDGMQGMLLTLDSPGLTWCRLRISASKATQELSTMLDSVAAYHMLALSALWAEHLKVERVSVR